MKNILIISNFFYPEITPRAFRTTELVKAFAKQGDSIFLILPEKEIYREFPLNIEGVKIVYATTSHSSSTIRLSEKKTISMQVSTGRKIKERFLKPLIFYFFPRDLYFTYSSAISNTIARLSNIQFDALISISHPLIIHLAVAIASLKIKKSAWRVAIAEFSDPMFKGNYLSTFPLNWFFGFFFSRTFKYFVVPVHSAIPSFRHFKSDKFIKTIPQGFDFSNIKIREYIPNKTITFAYAGRFYKNLRDPTYFLKVLEKVTQPFIFKLYISLEDRYFLDLLKDFSTKIGGVIVINGLIPRDLLIEELSEVDFLINFENENSRMVPSKLIDYALTERPILSFNSQSFDEENFYQFLNKDYKSRITVRKEDYDINSVIAHFNQIIDE